MAGLQWGRFELFGFFFYYCYSEFLNNCYKVIQIRFLGPPKPTLVQWAPLRLTAWVLKSDVWGLRPGCKPKSSTSDPSPLKPFHRPRPLYPLSLQALKAFNPEPELQYRYESKAWDMDFVDCIMVPDDEVLKHLGCQG